MIKMKIIMNLKIHQKMEMNKNKSIGIKNLTMKYYKIISKCLMLKILKFKLLIK